MKGLASTAGVDRRVRRVCEWTKGGVERGSGKIEDGQERRREFGDTVPEIGMAAMAVLQSVPDATVCSGEQLRKEGGSGGGVDGGVEEGSMRVDAIPQTRGSVAGRPPAEHATGSTERMKRRRADRCPRR